MALNVYEKKMQMDTRSPLVLKLGELVGHLFKVVKRSMKKEEKAELARRRSRAESDNLTPKSAHSQFNNC